MKGWKIMNRAELAAEIITAVKATTDEQIAAVNTHLTEIILAVQFRQQKEIIIDEANDKTVAAIKRECIRRYRYG